MLSLNYFGHKGKSVPLIIYFREYEKALKSPQTSPQTRDIFIYTCLNKSMRAEVNINC